MSAVEPLSIDDSASPPTDRVVAVLNALASDPAGSLTTSELAKRLGISMGTCHAIVTQLTAWDYLVRMPEGKRYRLGPQVAWIGRAAQERFMPPVRARDMLSALSEKTNLVCSIRTKTAGRILVLDEMGGADRGAGQRPRKQYIFAPPFGLSFVLWGPPRNRQEWLDQAPVPPSGQDLKRLEQVTQSAHRIGYSIHPPLNESRQRLMVALYGSSKEDLSDDPLRGLLVEALRNAWIVALLPEELDARKAVKVSSITAPIYDARGRLEWIVELHVNGRPLLPREIRAFSAELLRTTERVSALK